ncbi:MAG: membrane dipeptidase [Acidimicrobiales bacterium]
MARHPWVDVHAHPGRCFLAGLTSDDALAAALGGEQCATAFAAMREAGMAAVSFATVADLLVISVGDDGGLRAGRAFAEGEAYADHLRQLDAIRAVAERHDMDIARTAADISRAHAEGTTVLFLTCEGADFVEDRLERLGEAHRAGVRSVTLVHYRVNEFGDIQTEAPVHGGLTEAGTGVVAEMNRLGLLIDLAHATYETTMGILRVSEAPVMISHSHLNGPGCDNARLLTHDHARAIASDGGLIGAWPAGVWCRTFEDFLTEIVRLVDAVGVEHVAIGTDMDANHQPVVTGYDQFAALEDGLHRRGFLQPEVDRILGGNAIDLIATVCG